MVLLHSILHSLSFLWKIPAAFVYGKRFRCSVDNGQTIFMDTITVYFIVSTKLAADGILRGISAMRQFMVATFTDLILRVLLAFLLSDLTKSAIGIWCAWPLGWTIAMIISVFFYRKKLKNYIHN